MVTIAVVLAVLVVGTSNLIALRTIAHALDTLAKASKRTHLYPYTHPSRPPLPLAE